MNLTTTGEIVADLREGIAALGAVVAMIEEHRGLLSMCDEHCDFLIGLHQQLSPVWEKLEDIRELARDPDLHSNVATRAKLFTLLQAL